MSVTTLGGAATYLLVVKGALTLDIGLGRQARPLGPIRLDISAPPDVVFDVHEGPQVYVERIDINGNVRTLDKVVRREFRLVEGDAFNTNKMQRSKDRIKNLGFFKKVEANNSPGTAPDRTLITVEVEEQSTGELSLGLGFSTSDGPLAECEAANGDAPITVFEMETAAAFVLFARHPADVLLLEVGLGGRLDATNVVRRPAVTAITPVSLDHQAFLGNTVAAIAGEKAGILKSGVTAVIAPQPGEAAAVIEARAEAVSVPLYRARHEWRCEVAGA